MTKLEELLNTSIAHDMKASLVKTMEIKVEGNCDEDLIDVIYSLLLKGEFDTLTYTLKIQLKTRPQLDTPEMVYIPMEVLDGFLYFEPEIEISDVVDKVVSFQGESNIDMLYLHYLSNIKDRMALRLGINTLKEML